MSLIKILVKAPLSFIRPNQFLIKDFMGVNGTEEDFAETKRFLKKGYNLAWRSCTYPLVNILLCRDSWLSVNLHK